MLKKLKMFSLRLSSGSASYKLNFKRDYSDYHCNNNKIDLNYITYPTDQQATPFYVNIDNTN